MIGLICILQNNKIQTIKSKSSESTDLSHTENAPNPVGRALFRMPTERTRSPHFYFLWSVFYCFINCSETSSSTF